MYKERFLNEIKFHTAFLTALSKKAVPKSIHDRFTAFSKKVVPKTIHNNFTGFFKKSTKNHVPSLFVLSTALRPFQSKYI